MPLPSYAFVSVFAWPADWKREQMVDALARCVGIDPADGAMIAARPAPLAVCRMEERAAGAAVRSLRDVSVRAFAPTQRQIIGMDKPVLAKRLIAPRAGMTAFGVEPWRGETVAVEPGEVTLIVRAAAASTRSTAADPVTEVRFDAVTGAMHLERIEGPAKRKALAQVIELHTLQGARVRIDSNKFSFDVLGHARELADSVNAELLAGKLTAAMPRATVDLGFETFRAPPGAVRALDPGAPLARSRMPEFEFYSAWRGILHRLVLGT